MVYTLPQDPGKTDCKESIKSFYFSEDAGDCLPFVYNGCGGNDNRFRGKNQCERLCNPPIPVIFPKSRSGRKAKAKNFALNIGMT